MRFSSLLASAILATSASARSSLFGSSPDIAPYDDALNVPGDNPLQHCQDPKDDILVLESVDLDPNPPLPGQSLTVTAKGNLTSSVKSGAYINLQVKYGLITIIKQTADLCDTVKNVDLKCPIDDGETELTKDVDLPKQIPPGKYSVIADAYTKDDDKITCLTATVEFHRGGGDGKAKVVHQGL